MGKCVAKERKVVMYERLVTFGFNDDGYGSYENGVIARMKCEGADSLEETTEKIGAVISDYLNGLSEEEREEIITRYDDALNWGDVMNDVVPSEVLAAHGISIEYVGTCEVWAHDQIVASL